MQLVGVKNTLHEGFKFNFVLNLKLDLFGRLYDFSGSILIDYV